MRRITCRSLSLIAALALSSIASAQSLPINSPTENQPPAQADVTAPSQPITSDLSLSAELDNSSVNSVGTPPATSSNTFEGRDSHFMPRPTTSVLGVSFKDLVGETDPLVQISGRTIREMLGNANARSMKQVSIFGSQVLSTSPRNFNSHAGVSDFPNANPTIPAQTALVSAESDISKLVGPNHTIRSSVLTITSLRHNYLLQQLKTAEKGDEETEALAALQSNYKLHYNIESWWRHRKVEKLSKELDKLKSDLAQRDEGTKPFVDAAITIAKLYRNGVAVSPPALTSPHAPNNRPLGGPNTTVGSYYSNPVPIQSSYTTPLPTTMRQPANAPSPLFASPPSGTSSLPSTRGNNAPN